MNQSRRQQPRRPGRPTGRGRPSRRNRTTFLVIIGGLVIVGVAIVALVAGGGGNGDGSGTPLIEDTATPVIVRGESLPEFTGAPDPAIGQPLPTLSGTGLDGQPLVIGGADEPTVIVYLAHWCPHCQEEVPVLVDHIAAGGVPDGVRVVAVSTSIDPRRPNYPPSTWLEREGWQQPTLVDPNGAAAAASGLSAFPYFVAVDGDGNVAARMTGELTPDQFDALVATTNPPA